MKVVTITVMALILVVAGVWHFWPSPSPPVGNPQTESGAPPAGTGQQFPVVDTPSLRLQTPTADDTDAANRLQQVKDAKRRGDNFYENGQYDNAINAYQAGLNLDPSNGPLLQALRRARTAKAAEEKFNSTNAANRLQQIEAAKRQGDNYFENGQYDNAINAYQGGLKLDPSNAQLQQALQRAQTAKAAEERFNH
jgi:tetratricopeptide (TPR) repeat protein